MPRRAYKAMKQQPCIHRKDLRTTLSAQEPEFASMLSGERWEDDEYQAGRTSETELDLFLIKIMGIARRKLKGEARKMKVADEDEGYSTNSPPTGIPSFSFKKPSILHRENQIRQRSSSPDSREEEEDYTMSGGLANGDGISWPLRNPMQSPGPDTFVHAASTSLRHRESQVFDCIFVTPSKVRATTERRGVVAGNGQTVRREHTQAFGEQDSIVLD